MATFKKQLAKLLGVSVKSITERTQKSNEAFLAFQKAADNLGWSYERDDRFNNVVEYSNRVIVTKTPSLVFNGFRAGYFRIIPSGDGLEMSRIQVDDELRGKGLANLMMAQMMQILFETIAELDSPVPFKILAGDVGFKINNYTQVDQDVRLRLYTKFGFQPTKVIDNFVKLELKYDEASLKNVIDLMNDQLDLDKLAERLRAK